MTNGSRIRLLALASVVLSLAGTAVPATHGKNHALKGAREVQVSGGILVNGQEVPAGTYRLSWEMNGDERVEVRLLKGKRMLATASGRVVEAGAASTYDSLVYTRDGNGRLELSEIRFAGDRTAISLKDDAVGLAEQR